MKHLNTWLSWLALTALVASTQTAHADVPALLPLQGYLTDTSDVPLDGNYNVTFRLYDAPTVGNELHEEVVPVAVSDGYFTVYLGDDSLQPLDMTALRDAGVVFLTIDVDVDNNGTGDGESVPRMQLGANAFAFQAQYCGDAVTLGGKGESDFAGCNALALRRRHRQRLTRQRTLQRLQRPRDRGLPRQQCRR